MKKMIEIFEIFSQLLLKYFSYQSVGLLSTFQVKKANIQWYFFEQCIICGTSLSS